MRLLFVARHVDRPEAHMIAGLARAGHRIEAIVRPQRHYAEIMEAAGVRVHSWQWSRMPWSPRRRRLRALLAGMEPDLVHTLDNTALCETWRAWPGRPAAWIAYRGAPHLSFRSQWLYRRCGIARIACLSNTVQADMIRRGWPVEKLTRIYKGHDPAWYRPASSERLAELGIPSGARLIGAAARWREWKCGPVLLDAFERLPSNPSVRLLFVGEICDPRIERMRRDPSRFTRVHFVGHQPDAPGLLGACETMIMPSNDKEGLCKAVLEAMFQGVPAIVTRGGGPSEIVRDGIEGLQVPPSDPAALAVALRRMIEDEPLRRACAARAKERACTAFHIDATIREYQTLYADLVSESPAGAPAAACDQAPFIHSWDRLRSR